MLMVLFIDIVVCSVLCKAVTGGECGKEYFIEDILRLECFPDVKDGVWKAAVAIDGEKIEDVIDDINLVPLVDIFTGISDIISGAVIDVEIIVEIYDVVFTVDMSTTEEDGVNKSEIIYNPLK